ncbi:MAG: sensor histidine kinase [Candidatus Hodarchaeales archaeon]
MSYTLVLEGILFLFTSLLATYMFLYLLLRYPKTPTNNFYIVLIACLSLWSFAYSLEIFATTVEEMVLWIKLKFIAILSVPAMFLLFSLSFTNNLRSFASKKINMIMVIAPPIFNYLALFTNDIHHLFFKFVLNEQSPFVSLIYKQGILFFVATFTSYVYVSWSLYVLYTSHKKKKNKEYTKKVIIVCCGVLVTGISNLIFVLKLFPFAYYLDLTPVAFLIANIIFFIGIHELNLLGLNLSHLTASKFKYFGLVITDLNQSLIEINPKACQYLLDNPEQKPPLGSNIYTLLYSQENLKPYLSRIKTIENSLQELIENPEDSKVFELELLHPIKPKKEFISVIIETLVIHGRILGFIYLINDITDTKNMKYLLTLNNELKSNLLKIIAHDLNNKIMVIQGYTEIIEEYFRKNTPPTEIQESLTAISDKVKESSTIITDVSDYLRNLEDIGTEEQNFEFLNLVEILEASLHNFNDVIKRKNLQIIKRISFSEVITLADSRIWSVFRNILENSIKWSPINGTLEIQVIKKEEDRYWQFSFIDEGPGIPEEHLDEIFKPFQSYGKEAGSGLGLSIALEIIQSYKGYLWAENRSDRSGTIFRFVIPVIDSDYMS